MRIRVYVCALALTTIFVLPLVMRGQYPQQPTPDELKMTSDPKYPGATAIILNLVEITDIPHHFDSVYTRIKILSEKGLDRATVELPYYSDSSQFDIAGSPYEVAGIQGRTIQPDGTIVPLTGKPSDLLQTKQGEWHMMRKVFNLPAVQVGSIVEYYYQLRFGDFWESTPTWKVQRDLPVRKEHFMYTPQRGEDSITVWSLLPSGAPTKDAMARYILDMSDVPPAPAEEWMPPMESTQYKVRFYYAETGDVNAYWKDAGANWSRSMNQFATPSKGIHDVVNGLVAATDSDLDKARKLYKAVEQLDNTDYSRDKTKAERKRLNLKDVRHAEDVWNQKSGDSNEIALLYLAMLRAAGLNADAAHVVDRKRDTFNPNYMSLNQLDDIVVILSTGGKEIVLDPGERMCPFQTVSWRHSSAIGLRQSGNGAVFITTPAQTYSANTIHRVADIALDAHGGVEANVRIFLAGQEALYWRQFALQNDEVEVKKQFDAWIGQMVPDGVEAHVDHFNGLNDPDANLAAIVKAHGTVGASTGKRLLVPSVFFETHASHPFVEQEKRLTPVDMHYGEIVSDDVTYKLPAGLEAETASDPVKVPWQGHAVLMIKSKDDTGQVTINRTLARSFTFAAADDYSALRDFYQKVAAADQQQIVLHAAGAPKGN